MISDKIIHVAIKDLQRYENGGIIAGHGRLMAAAKKCGDVDVCDVEASI